MARKQTSDAGESKAEVLQEAKSAADRAQNDLDSLRQKIARLESDEAAAAPNTPQAAEADTLPFAEDAANPQTGRKSTTESTTADPEDGLSHLRQEPMMAHLLDALDRGQDIGHYGRLVFAMIAHHFLPKEETVAWLRKDPGTDEAAAANLLHQVESRDYNPPRRERILEWQAEQEFPILPDADDPDCGNVYRNLKFPQKVYQHIEEYQEEKTSASDDVLRRTA